MNDDEAFVFGPFRLSPGRRELLAHGQPVPLGARAFDLLVALVRRNGLLVSKDDLLAEVWPETIVEENNIQVQISALRKVLGGDRDGSRYLVTIPGRGYRFAAPVQRSGVAKTATDTSARSDASLALPDKPSIAVLPFENMSDDPEQTYFADGMAEEIITALSHCSGLFVIARNSSFSYKGRAVDVRQVGRELGVRYVLEGSVRRAGNRIRFVGQLIDATSGNHIWADRFDGETSDVFDLQDRMTANVVAAIEPKLQFAEIERIKQKPSANFSAYDHRLRALQLEYEFTEQSIDAALRHLHRAIELDPDYAPAMALAAYCYGWRRTQGWTKDTPAETADGLRLVNRALSLDKFDASVLWMSALAVWQLAQDPGQAMELVSRSLDINPNSSIACTVAGWIEVFTGRFGKGRELLARAQRLSPRDPRAWFTANGMAMASLGESRWDDGVAWARKARAQNPSHIGSMRLYAANLAHLGRLDEAAQTVADMLHAQPDLTIAKTREPRMYMHSDLWRKFSDGLRLAGLPE
jgi:TolB-like protein/cytochrome c-type biogenesis protein CcmH/NrfG